VLRALDRVAYVRFASVYRDFQDVEEFERELDRLEEAQANTSSVIG
jgi:transcriptional repressor NrdR